MLPVADKNDRDLIDPNWVYTKRLICTKVGVVEGLLPALRIAVGDGHASLATEGAGGDLYASW